MGARAASRLCGHGLDATGSRLVAGVRDAAMVRHAGAGLWSAIARPRSGDSAFATGRGRRSLLSLYRHHDLSRPRFDVTFEVEDLLPRAQAEPSVRDGDGQ